MIQNILLATDFSELSNYAKSLTLKVAAKTQAKIHVLNIVETSVDIYVNENNELRATEAADISGFQKIMDERLDKITTWCADIHQEYTSKVLFGSMHHTLIKYAQTNKIDIVILGTHGVKGIDELITGSVSEHLIKSCNIPVLTLKCDRETMDFSDILITGNFKEENYPQLDLIKQLQVVFNSNLHLLKVITKDHFETSTDSLIAMELFAEANELKNVSFHVFNEVSMEQGIIHFNSYFEALHQTEIDLLAVEKKKSGWSLAFSSCEATSLVNHIFKPILTYNNF